MNDDVIKIHSNFIIHARNDVLHYYMGIVNGKGSQWNEYNWDNIMAQAPKLFDRQENCQKEMEIIPSWYANALEKPNIKLYELSMHSILLTVPTFHSNYDSLQESLKKIKERKNEN